MDVAVLNVVGDDDGAADDDGDDSGPLDENEEDGETDARRATRNLR